MTQEYGSTGIEHNLARAIARAFRAYGYPQVYSDVMFTPPTASESAPFIKNLADRISEDFGSGGTTASILSAALYNEMLPVIASHSDKSSLLETLSKLCKRVTRGIEARTASFTDLGSLALQRCEPDSKLGKLLAASLKEFPLDRIFLVQSQGKVGQASNVLGRAINLSVDSTHVYGTSSTVAEEVLSAQVFLCDSSPRFEELFAVLRDQGPGTKVVIGLDVEPFAQVASFAHIFVNDLPDHFQVYFLNLDPSSEWKILSAELEDLVSGNEKQSDSAEADLPPVRFIGHCPQIIIGKGRAFFAVGEHDDVSRSDLVRVAILHIPKAESLERASRALAVCQTASNGGVIDCAPVTLWSIGRELFGMEDLEQGTAPTLDGALVRALSTPLRQYADAGGIDPSYLIEQLAGAEMHYNPISGTIANHSHGKVVDPATTVRTLIEAAESAVADVLLGTNVQEETLRQPVGRYQRLLNARTCFESAQDAPARLHSIGRPTAEKDVLASVVDAIDTTCPWEMAFPPQRIVVVLPPVATPDDFVDRFVAGGMLLRVTVPRSFSTTYDIANMAFLAYYPSGAIRTVAARAVGIESLTQSEILIEDPLAYFDPVADAERDPANRYMLQFTLVGIHLLKI